ncbi:1,3-beta-glucanosyltransferase [Penicillium ucsense]|uniref:1,3-beta-glucanosyltransferase n=1 Tax=Penicillium ucsense TaxID=2839758 RepID=A0A8J8W425_9EURO|nr:1,3-beta-glucanosyltransferase [Penicillium ucsense]KAF7734908.1 1,3-beta-glucanosyltransferase [Penicillium ucsense]
MVASYSGLLTAICALAGSAAAVTPLKVQGKDFVNSKTGDRFQILGVDYQPGGSSGFSKDSDPLSDGDICMRDAALMQRLGVNTIRVYNLEPSLDHNKCASIFNAAGIYMILDVNSPLTNGYLDRSAPWTTYTNAYYKQVFGVVEAFKTFDNVLGFFAGNEVINEEATRLAPAYVRAVIRDMKDYIAKQADRAIPVGYSAADVREILMDTSNYFECDMKNSTSSRADFFGLNSYSWCGDASYKSSGYDVLTQDFSNASLPVFFSEYGCNAVKPRIFTEVQSLYGEEMTQAFSGGLVYEWTQEENEFGLVKIEDDGSVETLVDYDNLQKQFNKLDISRISASNDTQTSVTPPTCDPSLITNSTFYNAWNLPEAPSKVSDYIKNGLPHKPVGSLVPVTGGKISQKVVDHNGNEIKNVELKVLANDAVNTPSALNADTSSNSSTSSATGSASGTNTASSASGTATKTNAASSLNGFPAVTLGGLSGFFMLLASLL